VLACALGVALTGAVDLWAGTELRIFPFYAIQGGLCRDGWLFRYRADDGFGTPEVAFVICSFWLVEALVRTDRVEEARGRRRLERADI
jgi:GH15 family glucan-1,4-alpha-glucosidase